MTGSTDGALADGWARYRTVRLETRRRNGSWVATPVNLAVKDGRAFFRTYDAAGKVKRLRNFPDVRITPCTFRGKPTGLSVPASARLLHGPEAERAREVLDRRYPVLHAWLVPWMHRRKGWTTLHYELKPGGST